VNVSVVLQLIEIYYAFVFDFSFEDSIEASLLEPTLVEGIVVLCNSPDAFDFDLLDFRIGTRELAR